MDYIEQGRMRSELWKKFDAKRKYTDESDFCYFCGKKLNQYRVEESHHNGDCYRGDLIESYESKCRLFEADCCSKCYAEKEQAMVEEAEKMGFNPFSCNHRYVATKDLYLNQDGRKAKNFNVGDIITFHFDKRDKRQDACSKTIESNLEYRIVKIHDWKEVKDRMQYMFSSRLIEAEKVLEKQNYWDKNNIQFYQMISYSSSEHPQGCFDDAKIEIEKEN